MLKYDNKVMASYRYCRVIEAKKVKGIVRDVVVLLGKRGQDGICKKMEVGVQRLTLVTPAENVQEEVSSYGGEAAEVTVGDQAVNLSDLSSSSNAAQDFKDSREVKNLKVPYWMKPSSDKRTQLNSIISYATLQGLKLA